LLCCAPSIAVQQRIVAVGAQSRLKPIRIRPSASAGLPPVAQAGAHRSVEHDFVREQVALLKLATELPIVYTVRSASQARERCASVPVRHIAESAGPREWPLCLLFMGVSATARSPAVSPRPRMAEGRASRDRSMCAIGVCCEWSHAGCTAVGAHSLVAPARQSDAGRCTCDRNAGAVPCNESGPVSRAFARRAASSTKARARCLSCSGTRHRRFVPTALHDAVF
jgi:hypothetical protein